MLGGRLGFREVVTVDLCIPCPQTFMPMTLTWPIKRASEAPDGTTPGGATPGNPDDPVTLAKTAQSGPMRMASPAAPRAAWRRGWLRTGASACRCS